MNYHTAEISERIQFYVKEMKKLAYRKRDLIGARHLEKINYRKTQ